MSDINLTVYDNEDLYRDFQLMEGVDANSAAPTNITGQQIACEFRDSSGNLVLRVTTGDGTGYLVVTDAPNGKFGFRVDRSKLPQMDKLKVKYDVLLTNGAYTRRLWGGSLIVKQGVTQSP